MAASFSTITRRGVIASAGALCLARTARATSAWNLSAYETAMRASGRQVSLTEAQFDAIQKRKPAAMKLISAVEWCLVLIERRLATKPMCRAGEVATSCTDWISGSSPFPVPAGFL